MPAPETLCAGQYRDSGNLQARMALHARFSTNPQGWMPWLMEQLVDVVGDGPISLLDVGCGPATLWWLDGEAVPPAWRVRGVDASSGMLADARRALRSRDCAVSLAVSRAEELACADAAFDVVMANHMLYHVDQTRALPELARVLRPGGRFVASTLGFDSLREIAELVRTETARSDFWIQRPVASFVLENAAEKLEPFFDGLELRRYEDSLRVLEVAPVIDYLRSLILDEPFTEDELAAIADRLDAEIRRRGRFDVQKEAGVFLARGRA